MSVKISSWLLSVIMFFLSFFGVYNPFKMPSYNRPEEEHSWVEIGENDSRSILGDISDSAETISAETWLCNELTLESSKEYDDYFLDCEIDMILEGCGRQYRIPGFWDGGKTYKVRFACPSAGEWVYKTICSDESNSGLCTSGKISCSDYSGSEEIYSRGFVTTRYGNKYFTYDDGTPFFYLGDTHWSLFAEENDVLGTILSKRKEQGYTVIQSQAIKYYGHTEEIMAKQLNLTDGYSDDDIEEFADFDRTFQTVAQKGFVHANAGLFGVDAMSLCIEKHGGYSDKIAGYDTTNAGMEGRVYYELSDSAKFYLEKISRLWCARYSAYPVLWTLAQEIDNDFIYGSDKHPDWGLANNPYLFVADYMDKYDAYDHPLTGHQESAGWTGYKGNKKDNNDPSAFNSTKSHTWFGVQYNTAKNKQNSYDKEKDYWNSYKPAINYEGCYDMFWTKTFGARQQGWSAFLSGMYGYGWGHSGTWYYHPISSEQHYETDVDFVTKEEQLAATWQTSLNAESAVQMGYMSEFFSHIDWWNLVPGFGSKLRFKADRGVYSHFASTEDNDEMVIYFYSFSDKSLAAETNTDDEAGYKTGTVRGLKPGERYHYRWFSPVTGEYSQEQAFTASLFGTYKIGRKTMNNKEVNTDMVLYIYHDMKEYLDVSYGIAGERQKLDLYLPESLSGDKGLILFIHGGAWCSGSKEDYRKAAESWCRKGYPAAAINYRYCGKPNYATVDDIMDDITAALKKIKTLAAKEDVNLTGVILTGGSAGGHLALLYGYSRVDEAPIRPKAVVSDCGPSDLTDPNFYNGSIHEIDPEKWWMNKSDWALRLSYMIGKDVTVDNLETFNDELMEISPIAYVTENTVPTVINHGTGDTVVPYSNAAALDAKLTQAGVRHDFVTYPNGWHDFSGCTDPNAPVMRNRLFEEYAAEYLG